MLFPFRQWVIMVHHNFNVLLISANICSFTTSVCFLIFPFVHFLKIVFAFLFLLLLRHHLVSVNFTSSLSLSFFFYIQWFSTTFCLLLFFPNYVSYMLTASFWSLANNSFFCIFSSSSSSYNFINWISWTSLIEYPVQSILNIYH